VVGGVLPLQVVAVERDRVVVVQAGRPLAHYAEEDAAALFFDRRVCEASPAPNFEIP
jgi:hypothetical protein